MKKNKGIPFDEFYSNGYIDLGRIGNLVTIRNHFTEEDIASIQKNLAEQYEEKKTEIDDLVTDIRNNIRNGSKDLIYKTTCRKSDVWAYEKEWRIVIVNLNKVMPQELDCLKSSLRSCGIGYEIITYTQSSHLLFDITDDHFFFDFILLDIEMPGITGMELSEKIKPYLPNVKIIFITSHIKYAIDAFELSIFRYVPKSNLTDRLAAAITDAAKLIELEAGKEYIIQAAGRMEKIPCKDIFYIRRDGGKNVVIVSSMGISKVRKSLQQIFEELDTPEFIFIDRGCIVNIIQHKNI